MSTHLKEKSYMSLFILIPMLVMFQLFTGAVVYSIVNRKLTNSCRQTTHGSCEHDGFALGVGAFWEAALPLMVLATAGAGIVHLGLQVGRTPTQRRAATQEIIDNRRKWKEAQAQAIEDELDLQLHGVKRCKHCNTKLRKIKGQWVDFIDHSNGCYYNDKGGSHQVPDELDAKLEEAEKVEPEDDDEYVKPEPMKAPKNTAFDRAAMQNLKGRTITGEILNTENY